MPQDFTELKNKPSSNAASIDTAVTHAGSSHAPADAQKNSDILKTEVEAVLTGELTSHSHAGGPGSGMTTLKKTADQTINGGAGVFVDITGLTFPVTAGVDYAFPFFFTFRAAGPTT